jgi:hypothetical protein
MRHGVDCSPTGAQCEPSAELQEYNRAAMSSCASSQRSSKKRRGDDSGADYSQLLPAGGQWHYGKLHAMGTNSLDESSLDGNEVLVVSALSERTRMHLERSL